MTYSMHGKVALVTGGGSGIGRSIALAFAREGVKTVVDDFNVELGNETVTLIKKEGGEASFASGDVSKEADVEAMVKFAVDHYSGIDFAVNNAGLASEGKLLHEISEASWDFQVAIDLKGVFLCMKHELAIMVKQGRGSIVNIASGAGLFGARYMGPYVASKHGVIGLTQTAAVDYAKMGIRVNAVCPGTVATPALMKFKEIEPNLFASWEAMDPQGRLVRPDEIANTVLFLCSDGVDSINGASITVDGGQTAVA